MGGDNATISETLTTISLYYKDPPYADITAVLLAKCQYIYYVICAINMIAKTAPPSMVVSTWAYCLFGVYMLRQFGDVGQLLLNATCVIVININFIPIFSSW